MTEAYPSDSELLSLQQDEQTGVEYIATGQSPYYLHFRKLVQRLLLATKRANDLRVFDEGGLNVGIKAGGFWLGTEFVEASGWSGVELADNKEAIYLYIDSDGELVTEEYSGFPEMSEAAHVRLAVVTTSGADITEIADCRGGHGFVLPFAAGGIRRTIEGHTADDTLEVCESGSAHTNLGATEVVTLTLPASAGAGTEFTFAVQAGYQLRIEPGSAAIRDSSGQTAGKYKWADGVGNCIRLVADENGDWVTVSKSGTWTEE